MSNVFVNFSNPIRPVGMLHGMNNGPLMHQGNFGPEYDEMGIPFVRFHETHSPTTKCVEIPYIFRDFDADENDPANYFFDVTDQVIAEALRHGITVMYRLGMGTELTKPSLFIGVPKDFEKWARICANIVRHYNDGWANGFHYNIRYWEIWNEPDLADYWPGTPEEYFRLYGIAARELKSLDPSLKVGGYAAAHPEREGFLESFLRYVTENNLPLDFFSWHYYFDDLRKIEDRCVYVERMMEQFGLRETENINSEWHGISLRKRGEVRPGTQNWDLSNSARICSAISNLCGMILMQHHGVTKAAYYDAENRGGLCGLWDVHMHKQKQFYGFKAFNFLYQAGTEYLSTSDHPEIQAMAAADRAKGYLIVANYKNEPDQVTVELQGLPDADMQIYLLDERHDLELVDSDCFGSATQIRFQLPMPAMSAAVLKFQFR